MTKYMCERGHKWLYEIARLETCPKCGGAPMAVANPALEYALNYVPPANHGCMITETTDGTVAITCFRR